MSTTLTVAGYTIGGLDGVASVQEAEAALNADTTNSGLIVAYDTALANAAAALTAGIPGEGVELTL